MKYRKKPVVVEAIQFTRENIDKIEGIAGDSLREISITRYFDGTMTAELHTPHGYCRVEENDYILKDERGNLSTQRPRIFEKEYEKIE